MTQRNSLIDLFRFLFSVLVVGYHLQMGLPGGIHFFENGCLAVEFFFLLSGYFLARSIEKCASKADLKLLPATFGFMKGKISSVFPAHIFANLLMIVVLATPVKKAEPF